MKLKIKIIVLFVLLLALFSTVHTTYSRYVSEAMGSVATNIARWKFKINDSDISSSSSRTVYITPEIADNEYVADGKIAPGSIGYFDLVADATEVDVAFTSNISINIESRNGVKNQGGTTTYYEGTENQDLLIIGYDYNEGSALNNSTKTHVDVNNSSTSITTPVIMPTATYGFIRVYFMWNDDPNTEVNDDDADTVFGVRAANATASSVLPEIQVTLTYTQYTG